MWTPNISPEAKAKLSEAANSFTEALAQIASEASSTWASRSHQSSSQRQRMAPTTAQAGTGSRNKRQQRSYQLQVRGSSERVPELRQAARELGFTIESISKNSQETPASS